MKALRRQSQESSYSCRAPHTIYPQVHLCIAKSTRQFLNKADLGMSSHLFLSVIFVFTARERSCGKVMFSQTSVCSQGVCIPTMPWKGRQLPLRRQTTREGNPPPSQDRSPQKADPPPHTIKQWAVRNLLECILVELYISKYV